MFYLFLFYALQVCSGNKNCSKFPNHIATISKITKTKEGRRSIEGLAKTKKDSYGKKQQHCLPLSIDFITFTKGLGCVLNLWESLQEIILNQ